MFKPLTYQARFELSGGMPKVMQACTLALTIKAFQDLPNTSVHFYAPEGVALVNGQQTARLNLSKGDSIAIPYVLRALRPGAFRVDARISPPQPDSLHWEEGASYYIVSRLDAAFCSDTSLSHFVYNIGLASMKPIPTKMLNLTIEFRGTVGYKNYDHDGDFTPLPDIEMFLATVSGDVVGSWNTDDSGSYDQTFDNLASGVYYLVVLSRNSAAEVHGWPFGNPYHLASQGFAVTGSGVVDWSPNIEGHPDGWYLEDVCQILMNIRASKIWAQDHFSYALDFVNVKHPLPSYLTSSCYVPEAHSTFTWGPVIPGTDAIYIKYGTWVQPHNDIWGHRGKAVTSHEWGHAFMMKTFVDMIPVGLGFSDDHWYYTVKNAGFALGEGFAEFVGPAVWLDTFGSSVDEGTGYLEKYYAYAARPWWQGEDETCTDGRIVEGANMQVFWDLFDEQNSNDHSQGIDDDGISNQCYQIGQTLKKIQQDIERFWSFEYLDSAHWYIIGWVQRGYIDIDTFRKKWYEQEYPFIDELYNVDLFGTKPPAPTELSVTGRGLHYVDVEWTDNSENEGMFLVRCRPSGSQQYLDELPQQCQPSPGTGQAVSYRYENSELQNGVTYEFSVAALTCDTSAWSDEAEAPPSDVSCIAIDAPSDTIPWGDVTPSARTYNSGSYTGSYAVRMRIVNASDSVVYDTTAAVSGHAPQDTELVNFPTWHADPQGQYVVACSTELASDGVSANDKLTDTCRVRYPRDISADNITSPSRVGYYEWLVPRGIVTNHYDDELTFWVKFVIDSVYADSHQVTMSGLSSQVEGFDSVRAIEPGPHDMKLIVRLDGDDHPANDTFSAQLLVVDDDYWARLSDLPGTTTQGFVLVEGPDTCQSVYAVRRDGSAFAKYSVSSEQWNDGGAPSSSPLANHYAADRYGNFIYVLGTYGPRTAIARYNIVTNGWDTLTTSLPAGVAENGGVFARHSDTLYVLLRNTMQSFYRYVVPTRSWTWLNLEPPLGSYGTAASAYDGSGLIHLLQVTQNSHGILQTYTINMGQWVQSETLDNALTSGCGIAITTVSGRNSVFALWPTSNVTPGVSSFDEYNLSSSEWTPCWPYFDSIGPHPSMTSRDGLPYAACGVPQAAVRTFGRYYPAPLALGREGLCANAGPRVTEYGLNSEPNPFTHSTTIRWQVPKATRALVAVYDAQGRLVKKLHDGSFEPGRYSQVWNTQGMPAGVYLCSFTSSERRMTQRLILMK